VYVYLISSTVMITINAIVSSCCHIFCSVLMTKAVFYVTYFNLRLIVMPDISYSMMSMYADYYQCNVHIVSCRIFFSVTISWLRSAPLFFSLYVLHLIIVFSCKFQTVFLLSCSMKLFCVFVCVFVAIMYFLLYAVNNLSNYRHYIDN